MQIFPLPLYSSCTECRDACTGLLLFMKKGKHRHEPAWCFPARKTMLHNLLSKLPRKAFSQAWLAWTFLFKNDLCLTDALL